MSAHHFFCRHRAEGCRSLTGLKRTDRTESAPQLYVLMGSDREWSQMSTAAPAVANLSSSQ